MKKITKILSMLLILTMMATVIPERTVNAAVKTTETGYGCKSGKYIYYAFEMEGIRMGIMRLDTETRSKREICSYEYKGQSTNGFYNLNVKGNYIYATWDFYRGTAASECYIYRISLNGKPAKRLACGMNPVIVGNRIYYDQCKVTKMDGDKVTVNTGKKYSMKLNGKNKKPAGKVKIQKRGYSIWESSAKKIKIGKYKYYIGNNNKTLYRYNTKTKKKKAVITYKDELYSFFVCGDRVITKGYVRGGKYRVQIVTHCTKTNGKKDIQLASWSAGE